MGIKVVFVGPTKGFLLGLKKLGFPAKRTFIISRVDAAADLTYRDGEAVLADLQRGFKQKYNRRLSNTFEWSAYGGTERDSRNRDVYLKTNRWVRIEVRIQKPAAVARLGLNNPATLAGFSSDDFTELFDRLLTWRPYTQRDLARAAETTRHALHLGRTFDWAQRGWLFGRAKLSFGEVVQGWQVEPVLRGRLLGDV